MCKAPVREAVPIPGARDYRTSFSAAGACPNRCANCGATLRVPGAKPPPLGDGRDGSPPDRGACGPDRARFCTSECFYSHMFRTEPIDDDDD
mmetsp:Transcript_17360/g.58200  ORF Transcript_17360/g.58200 Transcript_17360/m.58200 type:complete len:92 (-) Transcript_17360:15-290(-)